MTDRIEVCGSTVFADGVPVAELLDDAPPTIAWAFERTLRKVSTSNAYACERDPAR
jgi:hypothetical protein